MESNVKGESLGPFSKSRKVGKKGLRTIEGGIEMPKKLVFKNWEPGGEYTLPLHIKNIKLRTQKVYFQLCSDIFSTPACDLPLTMCSGTSHTFYITYRPFEKLRNEAAMMFQTEDGDEMKVSLEAVLPYPDIALPDLLVFGKCALHEVVSINFEMSNTGDAPANYSWSVPEGFSIEPVAGLLSPKATGKFKASFAPVAANVYRGMASSAFSDKGSESEAVYIKIGGYNFKKSMKLEGIGKLVHLTAKPCLSSEDSGVSSGKESSGNAGKTFENFTLDFGTVAIGRLWDILVKVTNTSEVMCHFSVHPYDPDNSLSMFSCEEGERELQPHCSAMVRVTYAPHTLTAHLECRYFVVKSHSGYGNVKFRCIGRCEGPKVVIVNSTSVLDFGSVGCGSSSGVVLHLSNLSDIPTVFQIQSSPSSVFCCSELGGDVGAQSSVFIPVKFSPTNSIPYCRLVYIIVQHQDPLAVCFIGNGFSESQIPVDLKPIILSRYLEHAQSGVSLLPPQKLRELLDTGALESDPQSGVLTAPPSESRLLPEPEEFHLASPSSSYCTYFTCQNDMSTFQHITCDVDILKFDYCPPDLSSVGKNLTITNHTHGEVSCVWTEKPLEHFSIIPKERTILAGKKATFTLFFRPDRANEFYSSEVECYVYYTELKDYHHVDPLTITPPWCVTATLTGHTFSKPFKYSSPKLSSDCVNLYLTPTTPGRPVFLTVLLTNVALSTSMFDIPMDRSQPFSVKTNHGVLGAGPRLIAMQLLPMSVQNYSHTLQYYLSNPACSHAKNICLHGSCRIPKLSILDDGKLFFKPTNIQSFSEQICYIQNTTQLPIRYRWRVSVLDQDQFQVDSKDGLIEPDEIQVHKWYFSPLEGGECSSRAALISSFAHLPMDRTRFRAWLDLYGLADDGLLQCEPSSIDFGGHPVHFGIGHTIILKNPSLCDLHYVLETTATESDGSVPQESPVKVVPCEGVVYSRSTAPVKVKVKPRSSGEFFCSLKYRLKARHPSGWKREDSTLYELAEMKFISAYPTLRVMDVVGGGGLANISKVTLRKMFCIDELNAALCDVPSNLELRYAINTRHSLRRKMPVLTKTIVDCNFGVAPVDSQNTCTSFKLKNDSLVATKWAFKVPTDVWLDPEAWADNEELNESEEHESFILTNHIITVTPSKGSLKPGATVVVTFTYKHSHVGIHKLPVLLKIDMGREILLVWQGTTVEKGIPYLHMNPCDQLLAPAYVGSHAFVKQSIPVYNGGDRRAEYEVGVAAFQDLDNINYHVPLFECLQPKGVIEPRQRKLIECLFSPMEPMKYTIDMPMSLSGGEVTSLSLVGAGEIPRHKGISTTTVQCKSLDGRDGIIDERHVAQLSEESVNFGCIPQFTVLQRVVFITNISSHSLSFSWRPEDKDFDQVVQVDPDQGYLQPGRGVACKLTFHAHQPPCMYSFNLLCSVVDESEQQVYKAALGAWHKRQEDKKHSILIKNESTRFVQGEVYDSELQEPKQPTATQQDPDAQTYEDWKKTELYKRSKKRPPAFPKIERDDPPDEPVPLELCASVKAETLSIPDFITLQGSIEGFFMDYGSMADRDGGERQVTEEERDCLTLVLNQVTRELLDDENFQESLTVIKNEPILYFNQFASQYQSTTKQVYETSIGSQRSIVDADHKRVWDTEQGPVDRSSALPESESQVLGERESQALGAVDTESCKAIAPGRQVEVGGQQTMMEQILEETVRNILTEFETDDRALISTSGSRTSPLEL